MSILNLVSQTAAANPVVGAAVAMSSTNSALLAGMQSGDTAMGGLLGAVSTQAVMANQLLASITGTGGNINLRA